MEAIDPSGTLFALALLVLGFTLYFLPTMIGWKKKNRTAILLVNFFLGWTLIGWVAALVWAVAHENQPIQVVMQDRTSAELCSNCGKYSTPGSKFCASCGAPISGQAPTGTKPSLAIGMQRGKT